MNLKGWQESFDYWNCLLQTGRTLKASRPGAAELVKFARPSVDDRSVREWDRTGVPLTFYR